MLLVRVMMPFVAIAPQGTHQAEGTRGVAFRPGGIPLRQFAWFETLFKSMSHFSLGTQKLSDEQVRWFCGAAAGQGLDLPPGRESASTSDLLPWASDPPQGGAPRRTIEIDRIIRDSAVSLQVKRLHACQCQVCGLALEAPDGLYAEGAHIRPLGEPHTGADVPGNVLCLCPNHHVLLDRGAFSVADSLELIGLGGRLREVAGHEVDVANFAYHRQLWMPAPVA